MGCVCGKRGGSEGQPQPPPPLQPPPPPPPQQPSSSPKEKAFRIRRSGSGMVDSVDTKASKPPSHRTNGHATAAEDVAELRKERLLTTPSLSREREPVLEQSGERIPERERDRQTERVRERDKDREENSSSSSAMGAASGGIVAPQALPAGKAAQVAGGDSSTAGWPTWLAAVAGEAIKGWVPRRADSFEKLDKIGQGTYSNVYKARDLDTGRLVALKKVRFDNLEPESVRFMAREIEVLRRLDHPNIVKLEGLVTSRMSCSLYLVFEYMEHDLAGLAASPGISFTEAQVKCYMQQLFRGLEHCHANGVLHRDIKGSNLLLDNFGVLKIADFGLATFYRPEQNVPLTSRVVTLWYRPPELLLGATNYGVAVDLWSSGCILAELLAGKPIMPGRTEVEQLHKIFKLCGSPSEEYWRRSKLPHATIFKPTQPYKRCLGEQFKDFPPTSLALVERLLSIEPADRGTAAAALQSDFFTTKPLPCDPASLPQYPPSKEYDAKLRDEETRRQRAAGARASRGAEGPKRATQAAAAAQRPSRAIPAPHANAELLESITLQKQAMARQGLLPSGHKSLSEKYAGSELAQGSFAPPAAHPAPPPAHAGEGRELSPVPPLPSRVAPMSRVPTHSSKSGPQLLLPKPGGYATAHWAPALKGDLQLAPELPDVRMAPPRANLRGGKSVTVPDFALAGGYPVDQNVLPRAEARELASRDRDAPGSRDYYLGKKARDRERGVEGQAAEPTHPRERLHGDPHPPAPAHRRTSVTQVETGAGGGVPHSPSEPEEPDTSAAPKPVPWRQQGPLGPLVPSRAKAAGAAHGDRRPFEPKAWMLNAPGGLHGAAPAPARAVALELAPGRNGVVRDPGGNEGAGADAVAMGSGSLDAAPPHAPASKTPKEGGPIGSALRRKYVPRISDVARIADNSHLELDVRDAASNRAAAAAGPKATDMKLGAALAHASDRPDAAALRTQADVEVLTQRLYIAPHAPRVGGGGEVPASTRRSPRG